MKQHNANTLFTLVLLVCVALGQPKHGTHRVNASIEPSEIPGGAVVERVARNSVADRAGMQVGDILLRWNSRNTGGQIDSPFSLFQIEAEQAPIGDITLEGIRGTEKHTWTLGQDTWGITARPNLLGTLLTTYRDGINLAKSGKMGEATQCWRSAATHARQLNSSWLGSWFLFHAASVLADAKSWREADDEYREAIHEAAGAGPAVAVQLFQVWGDTFRERSNWAVAEKYYRRAIVEAQKLASENLLSASILDRVGRVAWERGDLVKAESDLLTALAIQQKLAPGSLAMATSLNNLGLVAWHRGDLAKAEAHHQQALAIRENLAPGTLAVAASFNNLGLIAWQRGDLDRAEEYYRQDLSITSKLNPDSLEIASSYMNLGLVAWQRGDLTRAEDYDQQALALLEKLSPGSLNLATELTNLGLLFRDRGDWAKAERYFLQALTVQRKLAPGSISVARTLVALGVVTADRGDSKRARQYYREALVIQEIHSPGSLELANTLNCLGALAGNQGDPRKAEWYYLRVHAIVDKLAPESLAATTNRNNLGFVAKQHGNLVEAKRYFLSSLEIAEKLAPGSLQAAMALANLGDVARDRGDLQHAEGYYRRALAIREELAPGSADHAFTLAALAGILQQEGQFESAAQFFARAVNALDRQIVRLGGAEEIRADFRSSHSDLYRDYVDVLMMQKRPEEAFAVLERSRARTLLEMLAEAHIDIRHGSDSSLLEREHGLRASLGLEAEHRLRLLGTKHTEEQVILVNRRIDELTAQYDDVEAQIRATSPGYAALTQPQPLTTKQVQEQLLDQDTLLLEYSLGKKHSYVWVVSSDSLIAHELPGRAEIEAAARRVHRLLSARNQQIEGETELQRQTRIARTDSQFAEAARALSSKILGPIAGLLQNGKRLVIVSDGALQYIPFAALPVAKESDNVRKSAPLVVEHEIVSLPSASVLLVLRLGEMSRQPAPKAVAVLADPVFDERDTRVQGRQGRTTGEAEYLEDASADALTRSLADVTSATDAELRLRRLLFTRKEADAILSVTPEGQGMKALDFRASRALAMSQELSQYRIVHFATHGLLDSVHPELSGIVLSLVDEQGRPRNGFLSLQDIYNLNLPVDMVVLSACETGLGKEIKGEGLVGLTRGFMHAGASRVVASLWNVSDAATANLMVQFYAAMERDGMRPAAALRTAQIRMWQQKRWSSPYYWAAFQIQGDWK